ncbi:MAG: hypothetical protein QOE79_2716 [Sphingomonadales bacterium]|jgi:hypothetical protein|nr:hypothetical protein [Sphingomonadales bacterium]
MGSLIETLVGATVAAAGRAVGAVQAAVGLQTKARPLSDQEAETLRRVYRGALDLAPIRIVEGRSGLFGLSGRPFTLGNCIYLKKFDTARWMDVLVHEACHVRQYQHEGTRYVGGSLIGQLKGGAYDWRAERRAGKVWRSFGPEAQAQLIQDLFGHGSRGADNRPGAFFGDEPLDGDVTFEDAGEDLTAFARESVEDARRPAP